MNREEIIKLLTVLSGAYPKQKIEDPALMASAWELCLGDQPAELIYRAAKIHMETNKFFPSICEILENTKRARILIQDETKRLEGSGRKLIGARVCYTDSQLEQLCKDVGLGYPNDLEN